MNGDTFSVLIPDGEEVLALYVARCLAMTGQVRVYVLSGKRWAWCSFSKSRTAYEFAPVRRDPEKRFELTAALIKKYNIDVLMPVSNDGIGFTAEWYAELADLVSITPIPDLATFRLANNKWRLSRFAAQHQLPVPPACLVDWSFDFYDTLSQVEFPVLLKPTSRGGGEGIVRFDNLSELKSFFAYHAQDQLVEPHLIQSFVPGVDIGLSVLCQNGEILAYTIQEGILAQQFGPLKILKFVDHDRVLDIGRKLLKALDWNGVAHIDLRCDSRTGELTILEINPRYWGSLQGSLVAGVNFPYLSCLAAQGIPFSAPVYHPTHYLHTGVAAKKMLLKPFIGANGTGNFSFKETGLHFFLADPLPETVYSVAKLLHRNNHWFFPRKVSNLAEEILS